MTHRLGLLKRHVSRLSRQVIPGRLVHRAAAIVVMCAASPAYAEVCDKIAGDGWHPAHGPVLMFGFHAYALFVVGAGVAVAVLKGWTPPWSAILFGGLAVLAGIVGLEDIYADDRITRAAQQEGCRALWADAGAIGIGALVILAAIYHQCCIGRAKT